MAVAKKKKLSTANRRMRERSRLSFLFVIFFFGLFSLIIVMESLMADGDKNLLKDDDGDVDGEDYSSWDISYEESPPGGGSSSASSSSSSISASHSTASNNNKNINLATINIPYAGSLRYQGPPLTRQQALQHVGSHVSTLAASVFGNRSSSINSNHNDVNNKKGTAASSTSGSWSSLRNIRPIQPDWQKVVGSKEKFYVYSAYYNTVFE